MLPHDSGLAVTSIQQKPEWTRQSQSVPMLASSLEIPRNLRPWPRGSSVRHHATFDADHSAVYQALAGKGRVFRRRQELRQSRLPTSPPRRS